MRRQISIVIPTLNGGPTLWRLLRRISAQRSDLDVELLAVDSGSTDDTCSALREHGASVISVPPGSFNHGATRNLALTRARGEFAVLLVQDAVPAHDEWLTELVRPLLEYPDVAGAFARQQPWPNASRVTAHYLAEWTGAQPVSRVAGPLTRDGLSRMSPAERHAACVFDNVCSCIRLAVWRDHPFRPTPIAEDLEWALEVLTAGHRLVYAPDAVVWHSHERRVSYELQRTYLVHQRLQALFGLSTIPTLLALVRAVGSTLPLHLQLALREPRRRTRALARATGLAVALPLGQYLGARSAREGRELLQTRGI
jgi:GT2 family glycosyltransferase